MGLFWKICKWLHWFRKEWTWNVLLHVGLVYMSSLSDLFIVESGSSRQEGSLLPSAVSVLEGVKQGLQHGWQLSYYPSASSIKSRKQSRTELALLTSLCNLFSYSAEMSNRTHDQILGFPHIHMEEVLLCPQTPWKSSVLPVVSIHNENRGLLLMTGWDDVCEINQWSGYRIKHYLNLCNFFVTIVP